MSPSKYEKVCPDEMELSAAPKINVSCPLTGCNKIFYSTAMLKLHKAKVHGIDKVYLEAKEKDVAYEYHCPVEKCLYNPNTGRHFTSMKLLKQHYRKVHLEKKFVCSKCQKRFGMNCDKLRHENTCGVIYHCPTCNCMYTTREALLTHCTRQKHSKPAWNQSKTRSKKNLAPEPPAPPVVIIVQNSSVEQQSSDQSFSNCRPVLPRPTVHILPPLQNLTFVPDKICYEKLLQKNCISKQTAEAQTDIFGVNHLSVNSGEHEPASLSTIATQVSGPQVDQSSMVRSSAEVQTSLSILPNRHKFCSVAETQTSGDAILKSAMECAEIPIQNHRQMATQYVALDFKQFKSSEVQTSFPPKRKRKKRRNEALQNVVGSVYPVGTSNSVFNSMVGDFGSSISTQTQQSFLENVIVCRNEQFQSCETQTNLSLFKNVDSPVLHKRGSAAKRKSTPHRLTHSKKKKPAPSSVRTSTAGGPIVPGRPQLTNPNDSQIPFQNTTAARQIIYSPLHQDITSPPALIVRHSQITPEKTFRTVCDSVQETQFCSTEYVQDHSASTQTASDVHNQSRPQVCAILSHPPNNVTISHSVTSYRNPSHNVTSYAGHSNDVTSYTGHSNDVTSYAGHPSYAKAPHNITNYALTQTFEGIDNLTQTDFLDLADSLSGESNVVSAACQTLDHCLNTSTTQTSYSKASATQTTLTDDPFPKPNYLLLPGTDTCTQTTDSDAKKDFCVQTMFGAHGGSQSLSLSVLEASQCIGTIESSVQTLTSSTDLDQLVRSEIEKSMLKQTSGTDIHTQTADELLDFLMMNMETQTTEDLFSGFTDIETQTGSLTSPWLSSENEADDQDGFCSADNPASADGVWAASAGEKLEAPCAANPWLCSPVAAQTQTAACDSLWITSATAAETQTTVQPLMDISEEDLTMDMETQTHFSIVHEAVGDLTDSHTQTTFKDLTSLFSL